MKKLITIALLASAGAAFAQATPVGLWRTIDDETKTEKSLVRIVDNGGSLSGKIEKLMDPSKQDSKCDKCEGARKDQPVLSSPRRSSERRHAAKSSGVPRSVIRLKGCRPIR